jgi:hypothetical protein
MIPGLVSKLSEQIISLTNSVGPLSSDCLRVSSTATTTVLVTLTPRFSNENQICFLINSSGGAITATTAGNVATTCSIPNGNVATLIWSQSSAKWHVDKTT